MHGTICWSIAHVFQKLTGVAQGCRAPARHVSWSMHRSEGADKLAGLASKIEGGNYSVYICYIVAALVVFLVLAVVMGLERGEDDYEHRSCRWLQGLVVMAGRALLLRPRPCDSREDAQSPRSVHPSGLPGPREAHGASRVREFADSSFVLRIMPPLFLAVVVYARHGPAHCSRLQSPMPGLW